MKKLLCILTAVAMLASCAVVSFADEAVEDIMLISEAPAEEIAADSAAEEVAADSAAEEVVADSAAEEVVADSAAEITYTDLAADDWAYEAIMALSKRGIISGDANKTVRPADGVTRQEVAKIILGARGIATDAEAALDAADADAVADWAKQYVATAMANGIIKGYEDGSVQPAKVVTRAEFAVVIVRAISATSEVSGNSFTDVPSDAWYAADVECAKTLGIVGGYEDGSFRGENTVTRREAFAMVNRMVNLLDALQQQ